MEFIEFGVILKPQGIRGEVKIRLHTDDNAPLKEIKAVYFKKDEGFEEHRVLSVRMDKGFAYMALQGIPDRNAAEEMRGTVCYMEKDDAQLPQGTHFVSDLIGLAVSDERGNPLGVLKSVIETGSADVYVVRDAKGGFMFPALKRVILDTDIRAGTMTVDAQNLAEVAVYEV
jgi:16S rRNA processing protein RimM